MAAGVAGNSFVRLGGVVTADAPEQRVVGRENGPAGAQTMQERVA